MPIAYGKITLVIGENEHLWCTGIWYGSAIHQKYALLISLDCSTDIYLFRKHENTNTKINNSLQSRSDCIYINCCISSSILTERMWINRAYLRVNQCSDQCELWIDFCIVMKINGATPAIAKYSRQCFCKQNCLRNAVGINAMISHIHTYITPQYIHSGWIIAFRLQDELKRMEMVWCQMH